MKLKIKRGLWIVFTFNLLMGIFVYWAVMTGVTYRLNHPIFVESVKTLPDLTIKDKTIVHPIDANAQFLIPLGPEEIMPVYVRTDRDYVGVGVIQDGIYITRKAVSFVAGGRLRSQNELPEDGVITSKEVQKILLRYGRWLSVAIGLAVMVTFWILYLICTGLVGLISLIPGLRKNLSTGAVWRCTMWAYIFAIVADYIADIFGKGLPVLAYNGFPLPFILKLIIIVVLATILLVISAIRNKGSTTEFKKKKG